MGIYRHPQASKVQLKCGSGHHTSHVCIQFKGLGPNHEMMRTQCLENSVKSFYKFESSAGQKGEEKQKGVVQIGLGWGKEENVFSSELNQLLVEQEEKRP